MSIHLVSSRSSSSSRSSNSFVPWFSLSQSADTFLATSLCLIPIIRRQLEFGRTNFGTQFVRMAKLVAEARAEPIGFDFDSDSDSDPKSPTN